ncbi:MULTISPECIES: barstar family protein [unclassified Streptomyces]|uniref:barstar family protein n=1 Tax=unclassified Streptomyces TaxID=2593676 RepID=UPI0031BBA3E7
MTATVLDLAGVTTRHEFMDRCARSLSLPEYFGRNWDALADCLTDLSWCPAATRRRLRVTGWQEYAAASPREWRIVTQILRDASDFWQHTDTPLHVIVEEATNEV